MTVISQPIDNKEVKDDGVGRKKRIRETLRCQGEKRRGIVTVETG